MNLIQQNLKADPACIGAFITHQESNELINQFRKKFPGEQSSVIINRAALELLIRDENTSGIRFMYGMANPHDTATRLLVMMPCGYDMTGNLPNITFSKAGFLDNEGTTVLLDEACRLQLNHVLHYKEANADVPYTKIIRGYFLGKTGLMELLSLTTGDLVYHFGYDLASSKPFIGVITSADGVIAFDNGEQCPEACDPTTESCIASYLSGLFEGKDEKRLDILRTFRNELLNTANQVEVEKYYTVSASILAGIKTDIQQKEVAEEVYSKFFKTSVNALNANDRIRAFSLFEACMKFLTERYLYQ